MTDYDEVIELLENHANHWRRHLEGFQSMSTDQQEERLIDIQRNFFSRQYRDVLHYGVEICTQKVLSRDPRDPVSADEWMRRKAHLIDRIEVAEELSSDDRWQKI